MSRFAAAIAAAAGQAPMSNGNLGPIAGRVLGADGDGLAYYCAGNDECSAGQARINLYDKLRSARDACGASEVVVLLTAAGSHKGHRYAVARAKPYQGHRDGGRRPKNWEFLRGLLASGDLPDGIRVETTATAEADDLFAGHAATNPEFVSLTQDKDMRMLPGWHLDWKTHVLTHVAPGTWEQKVDDKVFGRKWFWLQLLMGDTADNIPGLPFHRVGDKDKRIGEKGAADKLAGTESDMGALLVCKELYQSYYGERWLVEMLEQGVLLWLRQTDDLFDVGHAGNPFHALATHEHWAAARLEIIGRTRLEFNETTEDNRGGASTGDHAVTTSGPVCPVQPAVCWDRSGAGPRPLNGSDSSSVAQIVQCAAGQDREQLQAVRREEPRGVPAWCRWLSAKA